MSTPKFKILSGNQAAAHMAYRLNEVFPIYPITPASGMSELVEEFNAKGQPNIFGDQTSVSTMQSESGVAGTLHGALQTGSLATTFTASQGLLLMAPGMHKMAGQLLPHVIHVATRSVATHALSVFSDHSDIMAVRNTGYAFLGASTVQEVLDFSLISQLASLRSDVPFVHFFDGFRTSHEYQTVEMIPDRIIRKLCDSGSIKKHRTRALNPNNPVIRGTAQGPDVFFQSRERINPYYQQCPAIVQDVMDELSEVTGRSYKLFEYAGHPEAESIIVTMGSSATTVEHTIKKLNLDGGKYGLVKVRLFRPFSAEFLLKAIPATSKRIAVLDRCKEAGSQGEPLFNDIFQAIHKNPDHFSSMPNVIGGRYGLSSKEFTPEMVEAILLNLNSQSVKEEFTVGINDDVTNLSLPITSEMSFRGTAEEVIFYDINNQESLDSFHNLLKLISIKKGTFIQGYTEASYGKGRSLRPSHLRIDSTPVNAPYLISKANYIACSQEALVRDTKIIEKLNKGGKLLIYSNQDIVQPNGIFTLEMISELKRKNCRIYHADPYDLKKTYTVMSHEISGLHACYLALNERLLEEFQLFRVLLHINEIELSTIIVSSEVKPSRNQEMDLTDILIQGLGNETPVSKLPMEGTFPTNTSERNKPRNKEYMPLWNPELCTQCGACSMACPQAALRMKVFDLSDEDFTPPYFRYTDSLEPKWAMDLKKFTIQVNPDQCSDCNVCMDACPENALHRTSKEDINGSAENWKFIETIPEMDRSAIDVFKVSQQQLQEPLFKYADVVEGCGEAPYLKLLSQLFGDRAVIANATGASSIFGGALPTSPWSKNWEGRGPAWANSLYEDNAEFGFGFQLSINRQASQSRSQLRSLRNIIDNDLIDDILNCSQSSEAEIREQRVRVSELKHILRQLPSKRADKMLDLVDALVKKSVWIVGGDGWANDIGFGGLDHILASGENVNILVLDNENYDNTGGQMSGATPYGASAAFAFNGKRNSKKDLGKIAMQNGDVYVASVAMGADQEQTLAAFNEAESYDGPSIIIAYCHSNSHGINMKRPSKYHSAIVNSGQWLLYRYDPRLRFKGENPLRLDSKEPTIALMDYMNLEGRFEKFLHSESKNGYLTLEKLQARIDERYKEYRAKADSETMLSDTRTEVFRDLQHIN